MNKIKILIFSIVMFLCISSDSENISAAKYSEGRISENITILDKDGMNYNYDAYYHKGYVYYSQHRIVSEQSYTTNTLYRMKPDGSDDEEIVTFKQQSLDGGRVVLVYGDNIYYSWGGDIDEPVFGSYMCMYNMKKHKEKYYKGRINYFSANYKNYYVANGESGDYGASPLCIVNAKNGKIKRITEYAGNDTLAGKKLYYIGTDKKNKKYYLYSCNINGKNKKKLVTFKKASFLPYINKGTKKYCDINVTSDGSVKYRYIYSSGKLKKLRK